MRRVLVTGSRGFIGQHVVAALGGAYRISQADRRLTIDLTHDGAVGWLVGKKPDVIVHLAGSCSTPGSVVRPLETFSDNVVTAVTALEAARLCQVPIIVTSSVKARDGMTPYGASKRMVELWAQEYRAAYEIPVIINRPGTIYGPGQEGSTESGWIAWFLKAKVEGLPVTVNGTGWQRRDLLHVTDYARLIAQQVDDPEHYDTGEIYDVGGGRENTVTIVQMIDHLDLEASYGPPRYGDALEYVGLNNVPDWAPTVDWRDGIDDLLVLEDQYRSGAVV